MPRTNQQGNALSRVEILAPAGDREMVIAAIAAGADAIYLGVPGFNARGRSPLLSFDEIESITTLCHRAGVKVYLAFNVLIFEREWDQVIHLIRQVLRIAPDAIIVQDVGLAALLRKAWPSARLHASTQMTIADSDTIEFFDDLVFARFVASRELSIERLQPMLARAHEKGREMECFARGALCISYSGQCLTSEVFGGGSANRGRCAQSCRFLYDVVVDGRIFARKQYAVSARDLDSGEFTQQLIASGVDCLKIEGRLKHPHYVYSSIARLRSLLGRRILESPERTPGLSSDEILVADHADFAFSRRAFSGWLGGINHQDLVDPEIQGHVGEYLGIVEKLDQRLREVRIRGVAKSPVPFLPGDGIVFIGSEGERSGGNTFAVQQAETHITFRFGREFNMDMIPPGARAFRNHSICFEQTQKRLLARAAKQGQVPVHIHAHAAPGNPLRVEYRDDQGHTGTAESAAICESARKSPVLEEALGTELSSLTGTPYSAQSFTLDSAEPFFLHQREWKECRRRAVADLDQKRTARTIESSDPEKSLHLLREQHNDGGTGKPLSPPLHRTAHLNLLLRTPEQARALLTCEPKDTVVYLDFEYGRHYQDAILLLRDLGLRAGLCTFSVSDNGRDLDFIEKHRPDVVLVRNPGALLRLKDFSAELVGDFSLNLTNSLAARYFLERGLSHITPSLDLNARELHDLLHFVPPDRVEVILHQHIPSFYMEYCLYARYLSKGTDHKSCGTPCTKHKLALTDPEGETHPVYTDGACRNTMFRGRPQSMSAFLPRLIGDGVRRFRIDLVDETPEETRSLVAAYRGLMENPASAAAKDLIHSMGWNEGQLRKTEKKVRSRDPGETLP